MNTVPGAAHAGLTMGLDAAHAGLTTGGDAGGMAFYRALADAELFVVLQAEPAGEVISPRVFDLTDGPMLLAFDTEERLASFSGVPVPYAALPGRVIAAQLLGQGLSLGLNLGTGAPSEMILPPEALDWLMQMLDQAPAEQVQAQVVRFEKPVVPAAVLDALAGFLAQTLTGRALLAGVVYKGGKRGVLLALTGVAPQAEVKMARAVTEALAFSGLEAAALDVIFAEPGDAALAQMSAVALVFDGQPPLAPEPVPHKPATTAPGSDPLRPPILR